MGMPETGDAEIRDAGNGERCKGRDAANWDRWYLGMLEPGETGNPEQVGRYFGNRGQRKVGIGEKGRWKKVINEIINEKY